MQLTREQLDALYELTVVSDDGETLGPVGHIYLDDQTQQAVWVTAKTGLFGFREVFAPFYGARIEPDTLKVRYTKDYILDAPRIDSDGHITEEEQEELFRYFRVRRPAPDEPPPSAADSPVAEDPAAAPAGQPDDDTEPPTDDDAEPPVEVLAEDTTGQPVEEHVDQPSTPEDPDADTDRA